MVAVNQNDLRVKNAQNFIDSLVDYNRGSNSYVFIGRPSQWETDIAVPMMARESAGDMSPPYPSNNFKDFYRIWNQMLFVNRMAYNDVQYMIPRVTWTSGAVFDMYRHDYSKVVRSTLNAENLYDAVYYTINQNRDVYVCLSNNNGGQSLIEPMNTSDEPFFLSDGYQWLRVYRVSDMDFRNKSTNNYIPISNNKVTSQAEGAVNTVVIESPGSQYVSRPVGVSDDVPYYYCRINGDGSGGVARIKVEKGSVVEVRMVRPGERYTYAVLDFSPNRVYASLHDLDADENGLIPEGDGAFRSTVIISPPLGWGYNKELYDTQGYDVGQHDRQTKFELARQLGATRVCIFSSLRSNPTENYTDLMKAVSFRQMGIVQDPIDLRTDNVSNKTASVCYAMKVNKTPETDATKFIVGEMIEQVQNETVTARGQVVSVDVTDEDIVIKYIQDPYLHGADNGHLYEFIGGPLITGDTSGVTALVDESFTGVLNDLVFNLGLSLPELRRYTGSMTYVQNMTMITREPTQSERISLIVEY